MRHFFSRAFCAASLILALISSSTEAGEIFVNKWDTSSGDAVAGFKLKPNAQVKIVVQKKNAPGELSLKINGKEEKFSKEGDRLYGKTDGDGKLKISSPGVKWNVGLLGLENDSKTNYFNLQVYVED